MLYKLDLNDNKFQNIPVPIKSLERLKIFSAQNNLISDLSPLLHNKELHTIDLRHNNITTTPVNLPLQLRKLSSCHVYIQDGVSESDGSDT